MQWNGGAVENSLINTQHALQKLYDKSDDL